MDEKRLDEIREEIDRLNPKGTDFFHSQQSRKIMKEMFEEIQNLKKHALSEHS